MTKLELDSSSFGTSMIFRLQAEDSEAWNQTVELYSPLVFHWCRTRQLSSADSADVTQEVFAAIAVSIHRFVRKPGCSFRGWVYRITVNKVFDHFRKKKKSIEAVGGSDANLRFQEIPFRQADQLAEEATGAVQGNFLLHRALSQIESQFASKTWQAFWQAVVDGKETRLVAAELGLTPNGVRQAKSRVLRRLRQQLGDV